MPTRWRTSPPPTEPAHLLLNSPLYAPSFEEDALQAEIAAVAETETPKPRRIATAMARLTLPAVVFLTLALELVLAERKFALFAGGFGQSQAIDTAFESAAFFAALLACQALLFYLLYRFVRRLHGRRADTAFFHLNFFYWATF